MYSFKQRVGAFFGVVFFMFLSVGISLLGVFELSQYLSFPVVIDYSIWVVFAAAFVFFFSPLLAMLLPVIFTGNQITMKSGKKLLVLTIAALGVTVIVMFVFSEKYTTTLMNKGYLECKGIPTGWMPGMATRYAKDLSLCIHH